MNLGRPAIRSQPVRAFSLIELLVVVAIMLVLFTLYWGGGTMSRGKTKLKACERNLQSIAVALKAYSTDNNGKFPAHALAKTSEPVLSMLVPRCTTATASFICPGTSDKALPDAQPFATLRISYAYYMGQTSSSKPDDPLASDRQISAWPKTRGQLVFSPNGKKPGNNHGKLGGIVLFCDGSTEATTPASAFNLTNAPNVVLLNPKP